MACLVVSACERTMGLPGQQAPAEASDVPAAPEDSVPPAPEPPHDQDGPNEGGEDGPTHSGCMEAPAEDDPALPEGEREARRLYACTAISLTGRVVAADGTPVAGATVRVHGQRARTGRQGTFRFPTLPRRNALVEVEAGGFRPFVVPVELRRALGEAAVEVPALVLSPVAPQVARMLFTGDVMLGRRFLDPTDTTPPGRLPTDVPGAFIRVSAPDAGSRSVLGFVRPLFQGADLTAINLESPVTAAPATPHPSKSYTFFTLPGSLEALRWMGVGYVSLGNNHVHDYLEPGLADTLRHLKASGLGHSGAGPNADEAFRPWTSSLAGTSYSFLSMSSIFEWQKDAWDLLASDTTGGAADLRDSTRVTRALRAEREAGRVPVALAAPRRAGHAWRSATSPRWEGVFSGSRTSSGTRGGDFAWSRFEADLSLPPEPARPNSWNATRALRLFLFHSAPRAGEGLLAFDDLAVVAWEEAARGEPLTLETPHPRDFLRLEAPEGTYTVRLTLRTHALPLP